MSQDVQRKCGDVKEQESRRPEQDKNDRKASHIARAPCGEYLI